MKDEYNIISCPMNSFLDDGYIEKFNCGITSINNFLINEAEDMDVNNRNRTTIFFDKTNQKIVGFYTINTASVIIEDKDKQISEQIPAVNLSYLARDIFYIGKNFGNFLIKELYFSLTIMGFNLGFSLLTTKALSGVTDFYKKVGFSYTSINPDEVDYWIEEVQMFITYDDMIEITEYRKTLNDTVAISE